jgi:hypothetical protein
MDNEYKVSTKKESFRAWNYMTSKVIFSIPVYTYSKQEINQLLRKGACLLPCAVQYF